MTDVRQTVREIGEPALAVLDGIDIEQQAQVDPQLNEVIEHLVRLRDALIARQRQGENCGEWLSRINGMLSGIFGVEYPAGGIKWPRVAATRDDLRDMLASLDEHDQR